MAIDIGNTNLTFGLFQGEKILHKFRLTTSLPRTSDEFGVQIVEQLSHKDVSADDVEDVIICSVVPKIMYSLTSGVKKYLDCDPMIVGNGTKSGRCDSTRYKNQCESTLEQCGETSGN